MSLQNIIDARLPGLTRVADTATFLPALAKAMEDSGHRPETFKSMRIIRIRYRPGERAILNVEFASPLSFRQGVRQTSHRETTYQLEAASCA